MAKLNDSFLRSTSKAGWHTDGLNGLYFVVGKTGRKQWKIKTRIKEQNIKKTIGHYPNMGLKDARALAGEIFSAYMNGVDYFAEQEAQTVKLKKEATPFKVVVDDWLDTKKNKGVRESTIATDIKRLDKHFFPTLGNKPINDITTAELIAICDKSKESGKKYTAFRLAIMLKSIFEYAKDVLKIIADNPASGLPKKYPKPKTDNNPHLAIEQIPELLSDLKAALKFELIDIVTYHMILIQLHTLSRPAEIAKLKWEYIDFDAACWTLPAEIMKNKHAHKQPLSPQVLTLLEAQRPYSEGSEYVFKAVKRGTKNPHRDPATANVAIKNRLKYKDRLTAHGMRRTAGNALNKNADNHLGYDKELIDLALAHTVADITTLTYNDDTRYPERRKMLNHWSEYLDSISG